MGITRTYMGHVSIGGVEGLAV